ncbi:hypothetical protein AMTRI_Chr13g118500 [Amborella trichopoda]|uniref:Uncharacterized protein n=1 Tax=Amborella trichopoda TaxID=13333 RepID=W1P8L2_AMBTC|nr:hypothetical protein AMTR_s00079p00049940 [Amborella trichopoda]
MEPEKRKRPRNSPEFFPEIQLPSEVNSAILEEEVEEFFAIIRRIHKISGNETKKKTPEKSAPWIPSFEWEDFEADNSDFAKQGSGFPKPLESCERNVRSVENGGESEKGVKKEKGLEEEKMSSVNLRLCL